MRKYILPLILLMLLTLLSGCGQTHKTEIPEAETIAASTAEPTIVAEADSGRKLQFSVIEMEEPGSKVISKEKLGGNTNVEMGYFNLAEVTIHLNGTDISLPEAIRDGKLTVAEIFAFARIDAQNGFCEETYNSVRGLTHFTYTYPECEVTLSYDLYETPDGKQTLIEELNISDVAKPGSARNSSYFYLDKDSEWGYFLDREDWGIAFEVTNVSSDQITLSYTQQGGQQLGELQVDDYTLFSAERFHDPHGYLGSFFNRLEQPILLTKDGAGQFRLNLPEGVDMLDAGEYYLCLRVTDIFEESEVHPLNVDYYDKQSYYVVFTIQ